jgi:adenylyl-sulfate kinase
MTDNGWCLWFTGLPCSGKTTLAKALIAALEGYTEKYFPVVRLDGDVTRQTIGKDLGFSPEDRNINIERVIGVASYLTQVEQRNVICSYISPYEKTRLKVKDLIPKTLIVHVNCPESICGQRDVKGMWAKAQAGEIKDFTGLSAPYEIPVKPDLVLHTNHWDVTFCVAALMAIMQEREFICGS